MKVILVGKVTKIDLAALVTGLPPALKSKAISHYADKPSIWSAKVKITDGPKKLPAFEELVVTSKCFTEMPFPNPYNPMFGLLHVIIGFVRAKLRPKFDLLSHEEFVEAINFLEDHFELTISSTALAGKGEELDIGFAKLRLEDKVVKGPPNWNTLDYDMLETTVP